MRTQLLNALKVSALAVVMSLGLSYVSAAWITPALPPPVGNIAAPINIGSAPQTKAGAFTIGTVITPASLTTIGTIGATGDICTAAGGGKCLSTAAARGTLSCVTRTGTPTATCNADEVVLGGSCDLSATHYTCDGGQTRANWRYNQDFTGNGFTCAVNSTLEVCSYVRDAGVTAYARCCKVI